MNMQSSLDDARNFLKGCKNVDDQARSGRPKIVDSEAVLQAIEASSTRRVSGEIDISQSVMATNRKERQLTMVGRY